jgi:hypothetical protein
MIAHEVWYNWGMSEKNVENIDNNSTIPVQKPDYYKLAEEQPERYRILESGAVYDKEQGRIVAMDNKRNPNGITTNTTQNMHKLRRAHAQAAILQGIAEGANMQTWRGGVKKMSKAMTELVMEGGNRAPEAFRVLLQGADLIDTGRNAGNSDGSPTQNIYNIGTDALQQVIEAIQQVKTQRQDGDNGVIDV